MGLARPRTGVAIWWWALLVAFVVGDAYLVSGWFRRKREEEAEVHIQAAAKRYSVEPALVKAVVWRESRFDPRAVGTAGELGLMQVGALAGQEWAEAEKMKAFWHGLLRDPGRNAQAGTWYLGKLLRRYSKTDLPAAYALADYNAGRSNVLRWIKGPAATNSEAFLAAMDFPGTRDYVRSIVRQSEIYRRGK